MSNVTYFKIEQAPDSRITKLAIKERFTTSERVAIRQAAKVNDEVYDFLDLLDSATFFDLALETNFLRVNQLETFGLLDNEGRANQILTAPVQDIERFKG